MKIISKDSLGTLAALLAIVAIFGGVYYFLGDRILQIYIDDAIDARAAREAKGYNGREYTVLGVIAPTTDFPETTLIMEVFDEQTKTVNWPLFVACTDQQARLKPGDRVKAVYTERRLGYAKYLKAKINCHLNLVSIDDMAV